MQRSTVWPAIVGAAAAVVTAVAASAQAPTPGPTPTPPPAAPKSVITSGAVTPQRFDGAIDKLAKTHEERGGTVQARFRHFHITWAGSPAELASLARYSMMLLVVLSQKSEELPLTRVYIQAGGRDLPVPKLSSWRSELDSSRLAYKLFGRYREDGFYLLPAGMLMREGVLLADFSANRTGLGIVQLPTAKGIELAKKFPSTDPASGAKPDPKALKAFLQKWYPGFPMP